MKGVTCFLKTPASNPSIGFYLGYTYRRASQWFGHALKPYDITPEQWLVLYRIWEHEGLNQKEVAAKADKDQPTTTRILDLLEKKGYTRKTVSPHDRRAFQLYLTETGKQLIDATAEIERDCGRQIIEGIDSRQLELFWDTLSRINDNLQHLQNNRRDSLHEPE